MTIYTRELIDAIAIIAENNNLQVCVKNSAKGGLIVGASAFLGSLLLGPVGLAVGGNFPIRPSFSLNLMVDNWISGTLGGIGAYRATRGVYKSAALVLREDLTELEKQMICEKVVYAFKDADITDVSTILIPMLMAQGEMQKVVLRELVTFFTNQMRMQIID